MAGENKLGISVLWKTEDWLAVWLGFLIIILILGGLTVTLPKFKWTTDGEFAQLAEGKAPEVTAFALQATQKGETGVATSAALLQTALAGKDRKAVGDAAKALADAAKAAKDKDIKKKGGAIAKLLGDNAGALLPKVFAAANLTGSLILLVGLLAVASLGIVLLGRNIGSFLVGFPAVFVLAWLAQFIAGNFTINDYGIEYVLWCLFLGLIVSNVLGLPQWMRPAVQTEYYIKTGLVILGAGILFGEIVQAGMYAIVQALLVITVVWYFTFWLCKKLDIDDEFSAMLSSAVSICGVSAAIATSGAVRGDPKKLSYVTSVVLICAVPMMVLQPIIAKMTGMPDLVAGAWMGGTLDTSGSVVAAGALVSETAMKIGVIVKMGQNVFIGFAAFFLAVWWAYKESAHLPGGQKPSAMEIWDRFPKFVLGFMAASVLFSFFLPGDMVNATKSTLSGLRTWWFALAFTCIGLETRFSELASLGGGKPALAFVIGQGVNIIWTLVLAYLIFGGALFPPPPM
ncbi:putative sulfate exporter family transporter [Desulfovibrio oxamicus]|uniref:Sulfate exporter family transporter n=1 Tax=Nitratidesulfovibrio oxamicus TaxID=32016 RepID=A0ABS0J379_9BACT|nr:putative sulfate exporter family transporter [Nitratidesulfovibrio oxamicus]MBG3876163.1 putative sulfate exporter family transporter [Nitratidesulfovibrio oxamicus]